MKLVPLLLGQILLVSAASAQAEASAVPTESVDELTPAQAQAFREGWKKLRGPSALPSPTVAVIVGSRVEGKITPSDSQMAKVTRADLRAQLAAQGITVVADDVAVKGLSSLGRALKERAGQQASETAAELLNEFAGADVLLEVELVTMADTQRARRMFRALDARTRPAKILAEESYNDHELTTPGDRRLGNIWTTKMRRGSTEMLVKLGGVLIAQEPYLPTYRIHMLDVPKLDFDKWTRAIRLERRQGLRFVRTPIQLSRSGSDVMPVWLEYAGEWIDLEDMLADTAEKTTGRRMLKVFDSGAYDFIISLQHAKEPWARFVGENSAPPAEKLGPLFSHDRKPTVAILFGEDTNAPAAALVDERDALPRLNMSDEVAAKTLGRYFASSGFDVKDPDAVRRLLQGQIARANLGKNFSGLRQALRDSNATDLLVLVRTEATSGSMNLTVLNNRGNQIAFTHYPDKRVRLYEGFVDIRDPDSLMRYLSGSLFEQLSAHASGSSLLSIEVVLKNTRNAQQALDVSAAFRTLEGVKSVTDLKIDQPTARFSVNTTGDATSLVKAAAELAGKKQLGAKGIVEFANEQQIVFNVLPNWIAELESPELVAVAKPLSVAPPVAVVPSPSPAPKSVSPQPAVPPTSQPIVQVQRPSPEASRPRNLEDTIIKARDSIWRVGLEYDDGEFRTVGTAWTVQSRLLATNAHVLVGLRTRSEAEKNRNMRFQVVARNGSGLERRVLLDLPNARQHPAYTEFEQMLYRVRSQLPESYIEVFQFITPYDVAVLPTLSDAGTPLELANAEELKALRPLDAIGYSGYPSENRAGRGMSQQSLVGSLNTITTIFLQDTNDPAKAQLIHFALPGAGGASGSPIFGPRGAIIGVYSAGDYVHNVVTATKVRSSPGKSDAKQISDIQEVSNQRIPIGFRYGQRVDFLTDLIEEKGSAADMPQLRQTWQRDIAPVLKIITGL